MTPLIVEGPYDKFSAALEEVPLSGLAAVRQAVEDRIARIEAQLQGALMSTERRTGAQTALSYYFLKLKAVDFREKTAGGAHRECVACYYSPESGDFFNRVTSDPLGELLRLNSVAGEEHPAALVSVTPINDLRMVGPLQKLCSGSPASSTSR